MPTLTVDVPENVAQRLAEVAERLQIPQRDVVLAALYFYLLVKVEASEPTRQARP